MVPQKLRLKILTRLAQTVPGAPASPASPSSPTAPTTPDSTTLKSKPASQPASSMMNVSVGWPNWFRQIDTLVSTIDKVIIAGTKNKYNFNDLFQNKFPSGVDTEFPPPDPTGDVIKFGRQIWEQLMNKGDTFTTKLSAPDMRNRVWALLQSPYLQKFQQINPAGPLGSSRAQLSTLRAFLQAFFNSLPQS